MRQVPFKVGLLLWKLIALEKGNVESPKMVRVAEESLKARKVNVKSGRVRKVRVIRTLTITLQLTKPAILR